VLDLDGDGDEDVDDVDIYIELILDELIEEAVETEPG